MGIRQLQKFVTTCVPNGFVEVSILEECQEYSRNNNGEKPTLVFDLMGILQILNADKEDMLFGRSHPKYYKIIEKLFQRLSEVAELVFFEDGPVVQQKYTTWLTRQDDRYVKCIEIIDRVSQGEPMPYIANSPEYDIPTMTSGLEFIELLAKQYGQRIVTVTKECDAELARYACSNPSVIAVLADDTDFLIFAGKWKYLSIGELNLDNLHTKEFSRTALRQYLGLNDKQLMVLSTIGGNDIVKYDWVQHCHGYKIGNNGRRYDVNAKFVAMANMIKNEVNLSDFHGMIYNLADFLLNDTSRESLDLVYESFAQYNIKFNPVDHASTSPLLHYCRQNSYNFVYAVLIEKPINYAFAYIDLRQRNFPDMTGCLMKLDRRLLGIILQNQYKSGQNELVYCTHSKRNHEEPFMAGQLSPEYPDVQVPDLMHLLDRENFPELDEIRFELLNWVLDIFEDDQIDKIPAVYTRPILTLYLMVREKFISVEEADIILLTTKHVITDTVPEYAFPPVVSARAFQVAFMYLKFYGDSGRCIKTCGLRHLSRHQNFEGGFFHKKYLDFAESGQNAASFLTDLEDYRIYKTL